MKVIIERSDKKSISLTVKSADILLVRAPRFFPKEEIAKIVDEKKDWISARVELIQRNKTNYGELYSFKAVILEGKVLPITLSDVKKSSIDLENRALIMPEKYADQFDKRRTETIKQVYAYAKSRLPKLVSIIGTRLCLCPAKIEIKRIRGKNIWGKCDQDKRIIIDYRVAQLPAEIQTYILIHEFCHLVQLNHSSKFWQMVEYYLPNYKILRKQLDEYHFIRDIYQ